MQRSIERQTRDSAGTEAGRRVLARRKQERGNAVLTTMHCWQCHRNQQGWRTQHRRVAGVDHGSLHLSPKQLVRVLQEVLQSKGRGRSSAIREPRQYRQRALLKAGLHALSCKCSAAAYSGIVTAAKSSASPGPRWPAGARWASYPDGPLNPLFLSFFLTWSSGPSQPR